MPEDLTRVDTEKLVESFGDAARAQVWSGAESWHVQFRELKTELLRRLKEGK